MYIHVTCICKHLFMYMCIIICRFMHIMPTLLKTYSNNQPNPVLCQAIEFVCRQFYILHRKPFILQASHHMLYKSQALVHCNRCCCIHKFDCHIGKEGNYSIFSITLIICDPLQMFGSVATMLDLTSKETGMIDCRKVITCNTV